MESPDWKQLFLIEQGKREEEQRRREEEQRRLQEAERAVRKTTLPEYLDGCHRHLHLSLSVQKDESLSTQGHPSNAKNKVRPRRLRHWEDFAEDQVNIWDELADGDFMSKCLFPSTTTLRENGEIIHRRLISSELDVHYFERQTVTDPVSLIIEHMHGDPPVARKFNVYGPVSFENHSNMLSPDDDISRAIQAMDISERHPRRRSPRLLERDEERRPDQRSASIASSSAASSDQKLPRPRADQFCVYTTSNPNGSRRDPVFIMEYKPPHKFKLGHIYEGLGDIDLDAVVVAKDADGVKERCQRLVAAVISQAFSYMIAAGLQFGRVCTGVASIYLKIADDPSTVYYYLSVPSGDVGKSTGWQPGEMNNNRLHLTAVGQMVALTLQAIRAKTRPLSWRKDATRSLPIWEETYEDMLIDISHDDPPSSEYRSSISDGQIRASPIQLRPRPRTNSASCRPSLHHDNDGEDSDASNPDTPSRGTRPAIITSQDTSSTSNLQIRGGGRDSGEYCTHKCILGLQRKGRIDPECPNAHMHGKDRHQIDQNLLRRLLLQQLEQDMDSDFGPFAREGSRGVPFKVRLAAYGYTFVAKCTPHYFAGHLEHEAAVYSRLRTLQGLHTPVCMGIVQLPLSYWYEGAVNLTHALLMSHGGTPINQVLNASNWRTLLAEVGRSLEPIHRLGVRHRDVRCPNILMCAGKVMLIDFERAEMQPARSALMPISANRKRKRHDDGGAGAKPYRGEVGNLQAELEFLFSQRATSRSLLEDWRARQSAMSR